MAILLAGLKTFFVSKYSGGGSLQWTVVDGPGWYEVSNAGIAVDSAGNSVTTGFTWGPSDNQVLRGLSDLYVSKYNSGGTRQWTVEDGAPQVEAVGTAVAIDPSGYFLVAGTVTHSGFDGQTLLGLQAFIFSKY